MLDFHERIIDWYRQNKRDLPWRRTKDPYKIWLSEIILQQTRVDQGLSYYEKFNNNYPKIKDLANAHEEQILNDWQGLGYYSRARNLHATAKDINVNYNGSFPKNYNELIKLKGVGEYTASAIASFAFNEKQAVVDGNVYRVLSRIFDIDNPIDEAQGKKTFKALAQSLIPENNPSEFNQAIMEFGALQCTPQKPDCFSCIFQADCLARRGNLIGERPVKSKKMKVRNRYFYFFCIMDKDKFYLEKRLSNDIWKHLYQFPLYEHHTELSENEINSYCLKTFNARPDHISSEIKHVLSHQKLFATFVHLKVKNKFSDHKLVRTNSFQDYPLPRLIERYLEEQNHLF